MITGNTKGKLTINSGQGVEIAPGAKVSGAVKVKPGGAIDVEGATLSGGLATSKATVVRICGAADLRSDQSGRDERPCRARAAGERM